MCCGSMYQPRSPSANNCELCPRRLFLRQKRTVTKRNGVYEEKKKLMTIGCEETKKKAKLIMKIPSFGAIIYADHNVKLMTRGVKVGLYVRSMASVVEYAISKYVDEF